MKSEEELEESSGPSGLWYLAPFFFGILGGIVGYVAVKDRDEDKAEWLLFFGAVWTVIGVMLFYVVVGIISYYPVLY